MIRNVNTLQIEKSSPIFDTGTSAFAGISENKIKTLLLNESKPFCKYHEEQIAELQSEVLVCKIKFLGADFG